MDSQNVNKRKGNVKDSYDFRNARKAKKDEFYTSLTDIEKEVWEYKNHFKGKTVYCNCDDPRASKFFYYFSYNFEKLGLKKLMATCYKNTSRDLFSQNDSKHGLYLEYDGDKNGNKVPDTEEIGIQHLAEDGDFRSMECVALLKQADIVVTNPPFSLFREYVSQLVKYEKKFLILGNVNAIGCKDIFPLMMKNKMWLGHSISSGDREFGVPNDYPLQAAGFRVDENGKKYIRIKGVRWYTNMEHKKRNEELVLCEKYSKNDYPKYDNYDAINIDKVKEIPKDYDGIMGVPLTFMDKYNPEQFEIVGKTHNRCNAGKYLIGDDTCPMINGRKLYYRILIRKK